MKRTIILYLFLIGFFVVFGQDSSYRLMTVDGKNIGENTYRYITYDKLNRIGKGVLNGQEVFWDTLGNVVLTSPYENMIWRRISSAPGVHHLYGARGGKWAVLNSRLEPVTGFEYEKIEKVHTEIAKVRKNGLWGAVDMHGNEIVPCIYEFIDEFTGDFTIVRNNSKAEAGVIYKNGKLVVPMSGANELRSFQCKDHRLIAVKLGWNWKIIDNIGNTILSFEDGEVYSSNSPDNPFSTILGDNLYLGAIDRASGRIIIEPAYDKIDIFPQGAIAFNREKGMYSFFNSKGELKLASEERISNNDKGVRMQKGWITYYYNYEGELIGIKNNEPDLSHPGSYYDENSDLFGYSDGKKLIIPCQYDLIDRIDDTYFEVWKRDKRGIIDINNKITLPIKYDYIDIIAYNRCELKNNNKYALYDWSGKQLVPFSYDHIKVTPFDSTLFKVYKYKDNKWGIRDINGKQVVPDIYTYKDTENSMIGSNDYLGYGYYLVMRNGRYGILNAKTYKEEIPCEYYYFNKMGANLVTTRQNDKFGAIIATKHGLKTIPSIYDAIEVLGNGVVTAQKGGKWGVIDENNNPVIPFENKIIEQYYNDILIVGK